VVYYKLFLKLVLSNFVLFVSVKFLKKHGRRKNEFAA
jgi:hypothetical protein